MQPFTPGYNVGNRGIKACPNAVPLSSAEAKCEMYTLKPEHHISLN